MEDSTRAEPLKRDSSKDFLLVCILATVALLLGYYSFSLRQQKSASTDSTSPEALIAAMMQTKGVIEAQAFVLFLQEDGSLKDEKNNRYTSDENILQQLASVVQTRDALRIEGSKEASLQRIAHVFALARSVGFLEMKYQILSETPQEAESQETTTDDANED